MSLLIKKAVIACPGSDWDGKTADILIRKGTIADIGNIPEADVSRTVDTPGLHVFPGFTDVFSHFCDPGLEHKEDLESGARAAAAGGYCRAMVLPNTRPALHDKSMVHYIRERSKNLPAEILPYGAITKNVEGKELAEMYDMRQEGAVAFSDGIRPVQNSQLLTKALLYVKTFNGVVVQVPDEQELSRSGLINEGVMSTRLGLPGKPALAESILLNRDIALLKYTGSRLHITGISTSESVDIIRRARREGLDITCSVSPYHLVFCDEDLQDYDTRLKVNPPLRTRDDHEALLEAVADGTIDCIASHHLPHETDSKVCEFEYAQYGMPGLETCFAAVATALPNLSLDRLAELFALKPASIFGLPVPEIKVGAPASITLVQKPCSWTFEEKNRFSKSGAHGFAGKTFTARPLGIVHGPSVFLVP